MLLAIDYSQPNLPTPSARAKDRAAIAEHVAAYLAAGGKIAQAASTLRNQSHQWRDFSLTAPPHNHRPSRQARQIATATNKP